MFGRLSHSVADRTASLRDVPATAAALGADAADSVRRAITSRRLAWVAALVLAFAVPFAVQSLGGEVASGRRRGQRAPARRRLPCSSA